MELKINIGYEKLLSLIKQLSEEQLARLLEDITVSKAVKANTSQSLRKLLLEGPIMSEAQYLEFEANRKHFNQWRMS
jgi:hypothetical protein